MDYAMIFNPTLPTHNRGQRFREHGTQQVTAGFAEPDGISHWAIQWDETNVWGETLL